VAALARLPVRIRVTLAFTGVMAVVLAATGLFVYLRLGAELDATIERGLRSRASDVVALVEEADGGLSERSPLTDEGDDPVQILDASGRVLDGTPEAGDRPLLAAGELRRARRAPVVLDAEAALEDDEEARLLATPAAGDDGERVFVVVGASLEEREDALDNLRGLLLTGGAAALLLAAAAGYVTVAAALRPVERMRRRAAEIQAAEPGHRLPVPPARDEIRRLGTTLNAMLGRLETALARERTFVADAGHELRTPLAILKAELELALRGGRSVAELEAALRSAAEETDRLAQLAEDLLVIARSDQGRLPIRREAIAAGELLERVRERFRRRAGDRDVRLEAGAPAGLELMADRLRLEQALGNLVDNALRHGGTRVRLEATARDGAVELHVRDDGTGFPQAFLDTAFERFTRADTTRGRGGAGLGLAIVAAIAGAHGGSAGARNLPGGGADVWITLPRAAVEAPGPGRPG
jgi:heavy metal sensor kinase